MRRTPEITSGEVLASALGCVERLERLICGASGVGSPAFARGRALAGLRAAGIRDADCRCSETAGEAVPVVVHTASFTVATEDAGVVLVSGSHQAALGNTLVAHVAAERLGFQVEHVIDPNAAAALGLAVLPREEQVAALLPKSGYGAPEEGRNVGDVLASAYEEVRTKAGTMVVPVRVSGNPESSVSVVALGGLTDSVEMLEKMVGGPVRIVEVFQCRPLPEAELTEAIAGSKSVLVVAASPSALHQRFFADVKRLSGEAIEVEIIEAGSGSDRFPQARTVPALSIGVHPGDSLGRDVLLKTGASLWGPLEVRPGDLSLQDRERWAVLRIGPDSDHRELDLVLLLEDELVNGSPDLQLVRRGGGVIIAAGESLEPTISWKRLPEAVRLQIEQGDLRLWWLNVSVRREDPGPLMAGAIESVIREIEPKLRPRLEKSDRLPKLDQLDPQTLTSSLASEIEFRAEQELPQLAPRRDDTDTAALMRGLIEFHLTGETADDADQHGPLVPALLGSDSLAEGYEFSPFYLPAQGSDGEPVPLARLISEAGATAGSSVLGRALPHLLEMMEAELPAAGAVAMEGLKNALDRAAGRLDLSEAGKEQLTGEIGAALAGLPKKGSAVRLSADAWSAFYEWTLDRERSLVRRRLLGEIEKLVTRLEDLLLADDRLKPASRSASTLSAALGAGGAQLIDTGRLSGIIPPARGSRGLSEERRERIEAVRTLLKRFLSESAQLPSLFVVRSESLETHFSGARTICSPDPFDAALGLFGGLSSRVVDAVKAVRVGNLELSGEFDPEIHSGLLEGFTWEALSEDEVLLIPGILVVERASGLPRRTLPGFHRVLQSGMPVHVAVLTGKADWSEEELARQLKGVLPDPGYLGLAHREAFVLQSSNCRPDHLLAGLGRLMHAPGPAVLVLGFSDNRSERGQNWAGWLTAWLSRTVPCYSYDPWNGDSWAERFSVEGNLAPEQPWVTVEFGCRNSEGKTETLTEAVTYAHFAALDSRLRSQFRVVEEEFESDLMVPAAQYLERLADLPAGAVPFIWVVTGNGERMRKAVITRDLLSGCRDRSRAWRILQELAGLRNLHVERAVSQALESASRKAEAERSAAVESARLQGATEAVERLVAALSNPDALLGAMEGGSPAVGLPEAGPARPEPEAKPVPEIPTQPEAAEPEAEPEAAEEEEEISGEPYIDSFLCTSCNDCINLNSRMFKYNSDRQAYIADASQGTFRELVRAAESCPASCIHPGQPRPGDHTATPELVDRAKAFQ